MTGLADLPKPVAAFDVGLRRVLTTFSPEEREIGMLSFAGQYSKRAAVAEIVSSVYTDTGLMAVCGGRSVRHPLGFDKFVLYASDVYQLRLHVWWPDEVHGTEHIHNHRFSFVSGIIVGEIFVASYRSMRGGVPHTRFRETRYRSGSGYEYGSYGRMHVGTASMHTLGAGCAYYLDSGELHRVQAANGHLAATLFIRLPQNRRNTDVLVAVNGELPVTGPRESMGMAEAKRRLTSFARMMGLPPRRSGACGRTTVPVTSSGRRRSGKVS